jgi:monovalent cation:H+ antiporter-2, CPA2 family
VTQADKPAWSETQVVIAGFGINGINLSKIFKALNISYSIIEINPGTVKKFSERGEPIFYGDITQPDNLRYLGVEEAKMMVIAISDVEASSKAVEIARKMNPGIYIIVRSEYVTQIENLYRIGADIVISQDFEASIEVASFVLKHRGIANRIVRMQTDALRKQHYKFFTEDVLVSHKINLGKMAEMEKFSEIFFIQYDSGHIGKKLLQFEYLYDERDGICEVIGIVRKNSILSKPAPETVIEELDTLVLYASQNKLNQTIIYLEETDKRKTKSNGNGIGGK